MRMKWSVEEERKETERKKRTLEEGVVYGKMGKREREMRGGKVGRCGREKEGEINHEGEEGDIEEGGLGMPHDVEITGIQNPDKPLVFEPTNEDWRVHQCIRSSLPCPLDLPEREIKQQLAPPPPPPPPPSPSQFDRIVGNGNCLYRALSLERCGTQRHHEHLKELRVDFMLDNQDSFAGYVGGDLGRYLLQNTMRERSWGSDVAHRPLFRIPDVPHFQEKICLSNLCGHFERVSSSVWTFSFPIQIFFSWRWDTFGGLRFGFRSFRHAMVGLSPHVPYRCSVYYCYVLRYQLYKNQEQYFFLSFPFYTGRNVKLSRWENLDCFIDLVKHVFLFYNLCPNHVLLSVCGLVCPFYWNVHRCQVVSMINQWSLNWKLEFEYFVLWVMNVVTCMYCTCT